MAAWSMSAGMAQVPGIFVASAAAAQRGTEDADARAVFERFIDLLYRRRQVRAAFESCVVREGFLDHGGFRSRASAMAVLAPQLAPERQLVQVLHTVFEGDIGMVHLASAEAAGAAPQARVEIFRIAQGRIVEHWSVAEGARP